MQLNDTDVNMCTYMQSFYINPVSNIFTGMFYKEMV
jgi:hypothetical protein